MKKFLLNLDNYIAIGSLLIIIVITLAGVAMRYVIGKPFAWLEEMQLFFFIYAIFFGGSVAFRTGSQVSIDLIANRLSPKARKALDVFDYLFTMVILAYLLYGGANLMSKVSGKVTPYFKISYVWIDLAAPVGIFFMMVQYTLIFIKAMKSSETGKEGGDK